jgi:transcriptional regulator with XRE-family HTH domain
MAGVVRVKLNLLDIIKRRKQTQWEFAQEVGLSANTVSNLIHDPGRISFETLNKLVNAGITLDELFEVEEVR